jgi:hypothetical protein
MNGQVNFYPLKLNSINSNLEITEIAAAKEGTLSDKLNEKTLEDTSVCTDKRAKTRKSSKDCIRLTREI